MAVYHLHVKNISRGDERSAVAAAAYRAGEVLWNEREEQDSHFGGKRDVVLAEIRLPADAPVALQDRATLWNAVEAAEKRKDARLAKEIEVALPRELPRAVWTALIRELADAYVSRGHGVDLAIHEDGTNRNPHAHLLLTTRVVTPEGLGIKLRAADGLAFLKETRALWAQLANAALGKAGAGVTIDSRSHAERGMAERPTQHRGPNAAERQAHRQEAQMIRDSDWKKARLELLNEPDLAERFPLLAKQDTWPEQRPAPTALPSPLDVETRAFLGEVERRADGGPTQEEVRQFQAEIDADRAAAPLITPYAETAVDRLYTLRDEPDPENHMVGAVRDLLADVRKEVEHHLVMIGFMSPHTAAQLRELENRAYPDRFSRELAAARAIEAKRREVAPEPRVPPSMRQRAAAFEREEQEREFQQKVRAGEAREAPNPKALQEPQPQPPAPQPSTVAADDGRQAGPERPPASARVIEQGPDAYRIAPQEDALDWLYDLAAKRGSQGQSEDRSGEREVDHDMERNRERAKERER